MRLDGTQRQLELQLDRLIDGYQRGAISVDQLQARRERLDAGVDAIKIQREELAGQQLDSARVTRIASDVAAFAATLRDGLDQLDFAERQRLVRLLIERVVVTGETLTIEADKTSKPEVPPSVKDGPDPRSHR